jgi:hypothetical protein
MASSFSCTNCGRLLKDHWLVCHYCHQARWKMILPYYFGGAAGLAVSFLLLMMGDESLVVCGTVLAGGLGGIMLLVAVIATMRGLTVRQEPPVARSTPVPYPASAGGEAAQVPAAPMEPPVFVDRLGSFIGTDAMRIQNIDSNIRMANNEPGWDQLGLQPGQVERQKIPFHMRETIDYLLDSHRPTNQLTFEHLLKLGSSQLRETIIRILGAMGSDTALWVLGNFANQDPLQVNEDDAYNSASGPYAPLSITWVMPLRELAKEEIQKGKAKPGKG